MATDKWTTLGKLWGGGGLILVALFMVLGFSLSGLSGPLAVDIIALLVSVGIPGVTGGWLVASHFRDGGEATPALTGDAMEASILKLAARNGGRLAAVEVAGELGVSAVAAKEMLDSLMARELADVAVTESGVLVYAFHDVEHLDEKWQARPLLAPHFEDAD